MTSASSVHSGISPAPLGNVAAASRLGAIVEVAVTVPVQGRFHYVVPDVLAARARVGARVLVKFARR